MPTCWASRLAAQQERGGALAGRRPRRPVAGVTGRPRSAISPDWPRFLGVNPARMTPPTSVVGTSKPVRHYSKLRKPLGQFVERGVTAVPHKFGAGRPSSTGIEGIKTNIEQHRYHDLETQKNNYLLIREIFARNLPIRFTNPEHEGSITTP